MKKCPSSIWYWDSNPRPTEHESPLITTRPGLPPFSSVLQFRPPIVCPVLRPFSAKTSNLNANSMTFFGQTLEKRKQKYVGKQSKLFALANIFNKTADVF